MMVSVFSQHDRRGRARLLPARVSSMSRALRSSVLWLSLALAFGACASASGSAPPEEGTALAAVRAAVDARYDAVPWVSAVDLAAWLSSDAPPQLLDSRARAEFDVSHLRGAVWIDPDHPDWSVVDSDPARRVVVYCSVGWRSGSIAQQLGARGRPNVFNLEQGLFGWANAGRPMVQGDHAASRVHPYDAVWGQMLLPERRAPLP
jgi:rhodanese-related sulfurtransferase